MSGIFDPFEDGYSRGLRRAGSPAPVPAPDVVRRRPTDAGRARGPWLLVAVLAVAVALAGYAVYVDVAR